MELIELDSSRQRVVVVGGGIAGPAFARWLSHQRKDMEILVVDRTPGHISRKGGGLAVGPNSAVTLQRAGVGLDGITRLQVGKRFSSGRDELVFNDIPDVERIRALWRPFHNALRTNAPDNVLFVDVNRPGLLGDSFLKKENELCHSLGTALS